MKRVSAITGGARGIGLAIAERFARGGDQVVILDIMEELGQESASRISGAFLPLDVSESDSVTWAIDKIEAEIGPIGAWVNCAGVFQKPSSTADLSLADHDRIWSINYRGSYLCSRDAGQRMKARGEGTILNVGSINSFRAFPLPAYTPTKAAIKSLTEVMAAELGPSGIRVNAVAPGFTLTPALIEKFKAGLRDQNKMENTAALRRLVLPEEIAEAGYFLCSEAASAITGVTLPVDCGWLAAVTYNSYPI